MERLNGRTSQKGENRRDRGDRDGFNFLSYLEATGPQFDTTTLIEAQRFGEALLRSVQSWRHREARRQEGAYERA